MSKNVHMMNSDVLVNNYLHTRGAAVHKINKSQNAHLVTIVINVDCHICYFSDTYLLHVP